MTRTKSQAMQLLAMALIMITTSLFMTSCLNDDDETPLPDPDIAYRTPLASTSWKLAKINGVEVENETQVEYYYWDARGVGTYVFYDNETEDWISCNFEWDSYLMRTVVLTFTSPETVKGLQTQLLYSVENETLKIETGLASLEYVPYTFAPEQPAN